MNIHLITILLCLALTSCENKMDKSTEDGKTTAANESDRDIVQNIRRSLKEDASLSQSAQKITVKISNGNVILQGKVESDREKQIIGHKAKLIAGVKNVDNQIEVF